MKFSGAPGIHSSFMIKPLDEPVGDPAIVGTLIGILNHRGKTKKIANQVQHSVVWDGFLPKGKIKSFQTDNLGLASGFHLYAVEWTDKEYHFFVDGKLTWSAPTPVSKIAEHILLCSKVMNDGKKGWAGAIPSNGYGSKESSQTKMLVDYVRVYERADPVR